MIFKNIIKVVILLFTFNLLLLSCESKVTDNLSIIEVTVVNHQSLDSLVVYDKEMSWEIKSTLRLQESEIVTDTLNISENKFYQVYSFNDGKQDALGTIILSPDSKIEITVDETNIYESINFEGNYNLANNFLAFTKNNKHQLSQAIKNGIEEQNLDSIISEKIDLVNAKGKELNIVDSLKTYVRKDFLKFSDILKQKNKKYLYKASLVGAIGHDFKFKDRYNNKVSLKDFSGKYLYLDVWATWCKPCMVEYPYLKKLEEHFINTENVQIISISTDRDFNKWENYITDNAMHGVQLYAGEDSDFVKFYDIGALPRFIFLDSKGKIINPDEIRPSNPELLPMLESKVYDTM